MQTFRKSKSRLLSGLLLLALIMYYLHPNGHFLTGHISAPIVGVDTRVVCMSPTSLPSGAGRKYKQNLVLKQRMGPARSSALSPAQAAEHDLGELLSILFFAPGFFYVRSLNQDFYRLPLTSRVSLMHTIHLQPQGPVCHLH